MKTFFLLVALAIFSFQSLAQDESARGERPFEEGLTFCSYMPEEVDHCVSFGGGKLWDSFSDAVNSYEAIEYKNGAKKGYKIKFRNGVELFKIVIEPDSVKLKSNGVLSKKNRTYTLNDNYGPCYETPAVCEQ